MRETTFDRFFANRCVICFFLILFFLLSCILRVTVIAVGNYNVLQQEQSSVSIDISSLRGGIYDCNMVPLTNTSVKLIAAVSPTESAADAVKGVLEGEELDRVLDCISRGEPTVCEVVKEIECDGITCTRVYVHNDDASVAHHLIGYIDSSGHGVSGLERAYDKILYSENKTSAVFTIDGRGDILYGVEPYFMFADPEHGNALVTTIDINVQNAVERAAEGLESGAVIVADAKTSKIRALLSLPDFDQNNVAESLNAENSPLLNKALAAYSIGSVFKPCVAAAALESGNGASVFECTGKTYIVDRFFNCHKRVGHGTMDMRHGLAFSCNCYFYNLAITTGAQAVFKVASALNFGYSLNIARGISTASGSMPKAEDLSNPAALANFAIGQGNFSLSPVNILTLYCAIAGEGRYYVPSVVEKTVLEGAVTEYDIGAPTRAFGTGTADTLRRYLKSVVTDGTGTDARSETCTVAGKTATAQTGRFYGDGSEVVNSWFCGFFPAEEPKYVVIVMSDGKYKKKPAAVFSQIATELG